MTLPPTVRIPDHHPRHHEPERERPLRQPWRSGTVRSRPCGRRTRCVTKPEVHRADRPERHAAAGISHVVCHCKSCTLRCPVSHGGPVAHQPCHPCHPRHPRRADRRRSRGAARSFDRARPGLRRRRHRTRRGERCTTTRRHGAIRAHGRTHRLARRRSPATARGPGARSGARHRIPSGDSLCRRSGRRAGGAQRPPALGRGTGRRHGRHAGHARDGRRLGHGADG